MILEFDEESDIQKIDLSEDGIAIIEFSEEPGHDDGHSFFDVYRKAQTENHIYLTTWLVFDLSKISLHYSCDRFLDRCLYVGRERRKLDCDWRIIFVIDENTEIQRLFEITGLCKVFPVIATREDAISYIRDAEKK